MSQYIPNRAVNREIAERNDGRAAQPGRPEARSASAAARARWSRFPSRWPSTSQPSRALAATAMAFAIRIWSRAAPPAGSLDGGPEEARSERVAEKFITNQCNTDLWHIQMDMVGA